SGAGIELRGLIAVVEIVPGDDGRRNVVRAVDTAVVAEIHGVIRRSKAGIGDDGVLIDVWRRSVQRSAPGTDVVETRGTIARAPKIQPAHDEEVRITRRYPQ